MALKVGEKAPDFEVTTSRGARVRLSDFAGKKNVVLYFYPADFTSVCTREGCGFRDLYGELASKDTEILGVSVDGDASHQKFADAHGIQFPLVSDPDLVLAHRYKAANFLHTLFGKTGRVTYVIDKKGEIAGVFDSLLFADRHLDGVRELVRKLG